MRMHEVQTAADKKAFIQLAVDLYANDPNWIRPLDKDIEEVFDVDKNKEAWLHALALSRRLSELSA